MSLGMERIDTDILVSGGGIAGLVAAAVFARAGLSVLVADPKPVVAEADEDGSDLRSTAFLRPSTELLADAGLWDALAPHATPLDALRVIDTTGWPPEVRAERVFHSTDLGDAPFGWNLPNWLIRREIVAALEAARAVDLRLGQSVTRLLTRNREALAWLSDGTRVSARLIVAADGRNSFVRETAGIGVHTTRYGQKAIACAVTHSAPHGAVSTEIYNQGGAFTLVPLPEHEGQPASAVVWMNPGAEAQRLFMAPKAEFNAVATERSAGILGPLSLASPRRIWPIVTQRAERLTAERIALVAEAAHVMPPIGAQGLNTSLTDIRALRDAALAHVADPGAPEALAAYARARSRDIHLRAQAIDLFNRVCRSGEAPVQALRLAGLKLVHDIAPVRRTVMRAGLGASPQTPGGI